MGTNFAALKVAAAALGLVALAACGSGGGGSSGTADVGSGTLSVALTDAAACGFDKVNITVSGVRVHQSESAGTSAAGWSDIEINPPRRINLLDLMNGVLEELGQTPLPAGKYTQIRLVLDRNFFGPLTNSVVPTGGAEQPLDTPSAVQSGIKLNHPFTVQGSQTTDLVIDFDACRSIVKRGNGTYGLKPVMRVMPRTLTGIVGTVDLALTGVRVSAQKGGEVIRETVPNSVGEFALSPIDPAQSPYDVVITASGHASAVVTKVPVVSDMTTRISTTAMPIVLPPSGIPPTHTVSGTVTPVAASAAVRALQAVGGVPAVEIAYVNANELGLYSLTLPIDPPVLAEYLLPLPLVFTPQAGSAGKYTIEAAATGYVTQTTTPPINLSSGDVTRDFTLIPGP